MNSVLFEVIPISPFQRQAKRLIKKFPSLKNEVLSLIDSLSKTPLQGTPLGNNCYKIRLSIASKNKGKSGGARVITCVYSADQEVYLLSIYDKSERGTLTDKEVKELIEWIAR
ncbi:type II toxin-antitoxin system RelE/ParE family toxin [Fibrella aquatilis]|uniref:Type II toxin-antitoxin system RelE/ParE family toxin n=1 Tax=Fibrella aquatilis TaxID=2817059 RepID=A0A939G3M2_9BACT|nr:type II toxin-antitoxin system RelE/ParE family toxin [Fibrella aquatilis]MBO0931752.1 type II toxin-antitoxin system RelE/ParE family toxin [Fibrella aquatilis]